jgi:hypothetical protein
MSEPLPPKAEAEIQSKLMQLLERYPRLIDHIGQPGWAADLCLAYWAQFEGLQYKRPYWGCRFTSPETILRELRKLGLSPQTKTPTARQGLIKSGPLDLYSDRDKG